MSRDQRLRGFLRSDDLSDPERLTRECFRAGVPTPAQRSFAQLCVEGGEGRVKSLADELADASDLVSWLEGLAALPWQFSALLATYVLEEYSEAFLDEDEAWSLYGISKLRAMCFSASRDEELLRSCKHIGDHIEDERLSRAYQGASQREELVSECMDSVLLWVSWLRDPAYLAKIQRSVAPEVCRALGELWRGSANLPQDEVHLAWLIAAERSLEEVMRRLPGTEGSRD